MAVKLRLARHGRKKNSIYYMVAADTRSPRDGRFIEKIGTYNPHLDNVPLTINAERALYWLMVGAEPTQRVKKILTLAGVMHRKHLQVGVNKGAISQEEADRKFEEWKTAKEQKLGHALVTNEGAVVGKTKTQRIPTEPERPAPAPEQPEEEAAPEAPEATTEAPAEAPADNTAEATPEAAAPEAPAAEEAPAEEEKPKTE